MHAIASRFFTFWFKPASPANLGFARLLFFGLLLCYYLPISYTEWALMDPVFYKPTYFFRKFDIPIFSAESIAVLQTLWKVALGMACLGLLTRTSVATAFVTGTYLLALPHNFGKVHHYDALVVFCMGILMLSRCGDAWSLDRLFAAQKGAPRPARSGEYTWPVRAIWLTFVLVMFGAGYSKLQVSGLGWLASENMAINLVRHHYSIGNYEPVVDWGLWIAQHAWLCWLFGAASLAAEALIPLALVSRTARWLLVPTLFGMQVGIRLLLGPSFAPMLICYLFWVPWDKVGVRLAAMVARDRSMRPDATPIAMPPQRARAA